MKPPPVHERKPLTLRQCRAIAQMHEEQLFASCLEHGVTQHVEELAVAACLAAELSRFLIDAPDN